MSSVGFANTINVIHCYSFNEINTFLIFGNCMWVTAKFRLGALNETKTNHSKLSSLILSLMKSLHTRYRDNNRIIY